MPMISAWNAVQLTLYSVKIQDCQFQLKSKSAKHLLYIQLSLPWTEYNFLVVFKHFREEVLKYNSTEMHRCFSFSEAGFSTMALEHDKNKKTKTKVHSTNLIVIWNSYEHEIVACHHKSQNLSQVKNNFKKPLRYNEIIIETWEILLHRGPLKVIQSKLLLRTEVDSKPVNFPHSSLQTHFEKLCGWRFLSHFGHWSR